MILFSIERVESVRESRKGDGVECEFGKICTDIDTILSEPTPLTGQLWPGQA